MTNTAIGDSQSQDLFAIPLSPWTLLRNFSGHEYRDSNLEGGTPYDYRVTPSGNPEIPSETVDAFVASGKTGLTVIEISDPENPIRIDNWQLGMTVWETEIAGLYFFDVNMKHTPVYTHAATTPGLPSSVKVAHGFAYVTKRFGGLTIIDLKETF